MWESLEILELTSSLLVNDLNLSPLGAGSPIVISRADTEEGDLAIDTCCSIRAGIGLAVIIGWWCWGFRQSEKVELFYSLIMINFLIYLSFSKCSICYALCPSASLYIHATNSMVVKEVMFYPNPHASYHFESYLPFPIGTFGISQAYPSPV